MNAATAALAAKAAKLAGEELLKLPAPPHGEWRGAYVAERQPDGLWHVVQSATDPMRLYMTDLDLEFAWAGRLVSDGGSIPKWAQGIKGLHLSPDAYLRAFFHHDALYERAKVWVREPGGRWHEIPVDRRQADAQLYCGLGAEKATLADAQVIYRAVRMFGHRAWEKCRKEAHA